MLRIAKSERSKRINYEALMENQKYIEKARRLFEYYLSMVFVGVFLMIFACYFVDYGTGGDVLIDIQLFTGYFFGFLGASIGVWAFLKMGVLVDKIRKELPLCFGEWLDTNYNSHPECRICPELAECIEKFKNSKGVFSSNE